MTCFTAVSKGHNYGVTSKDVQILQFAMAELETELFALQFVLHCYNFTLSSYLFECINCEVIFFQV